MSNIQQSLRSGEPGTTGRELFEGSTATGAGEHAQSFGTGYKEGTEAGDKGNHGEHDTDLGSGPHGRSSSRSGEGVNINPGQALTGIAGSGQTSTHSSGLHQNTGITGGISGQHAGTGAGPELHSSSGQGHQSLGDKARAAVSSSTTTDHSSSGGRAHGDHVHSAHQDSTGHMIDRGADPHMHQHGEDVQQGSGRTFDNTQSSGKSTDATLAAAGGSATGAYPSYEGVTGHSGSGTGALSGQPANIGSARGDSVVSGSKVGAGAGVGAAAGAAATSRSGDHGATAQSASLQGDVNKASQHGLHNQFDHADDALLKNQRAKADVPTDGNINLDSANPANIAKDKAAAKADQAGKKVDQESGKGGLVDKIRNAVGM